jgi:hypothetical protein
MEQFLSAQISTFLKRRYFAQWHTSVDDTLQVGTHRYRSGVELCHRAL